MQWYEEARKAKHILWISLIVDIRIHTGTNVVNNDLNMIEKWFKIDLM